MKSDRTAIARALLIALGGVVLIFSGCVTPGPDSTVAPPEVSRSTPAPSGDADSKLDVNHIPVPPHPDAVWWIPMPIPPDGVDIAGLTVPSDRAALPAVPELSVSDRRTRESSHGSQSEQPRPEGPRISQEAPPPITRPRQWHLPLPTIAMASEPGSAEPSGRSANTPTEEGSAPLQDTSGTLVGETAVVDAAEPAPDAADPAPDITEPAPDAADPAPDITEPAPDAADPAPDVLRNRRPRMSPSPSQSSSLEPSTAERTVQPGETFRITLPGRSWIYLGGGDALDFIGRSTEDGDTAFSYRTLHSSGDEQMTLIFESQDFTTGVQARHEEQVRAQPIGADPLEDAVPSRAAAHSGNGRDDTVSVGAAASAPTQLTEASAEELLLRVDRFHESEDYGAALGLLEEMRGAGIGGRDEVLFRLARIYEMQWEGRELRTARDLYGTVVDEYPLSRRRRQAQERIEYINRYFFHIR